MELGIPELVIILVIVILLWGPGRVAKIGGELGSGIRAFREGLTEKDDDEEDPGAARILKPQDQETAQLDPDGEHTNSEKR